MKRVFEEMLAGYKEFRQKYVSKDRSVMQYLSSHGQHPQIMVVACCDSRVDPALILQCGPGDLFVVRNIANIVPPFEDDDARHGTSAALEFGVRFLKVEHLIILGHSKCGGIQARLQIQQEDFSDFVTDWVSTISVTDASTSDDELAKNALRQSRENCETFSWLKERLDQQKLKIHLWFFDIKTATIYSFDERRETFVVLDPEKPV